MCMNVLHALETVLKEKQNHRKLILIALLRHVDPKTCMSRPGPELIASEAGYDVKIVLKTLKDLEHDGYFSFAEGIYQLRFLTPDLSEEEPDPYQHFKDRGGTLKSSSDWALPADKNILYGKIEPSNSEKTREERLRGLNKGKEKKS